jgi:hypothetical protein
VLVQPSLTSVQILGQHPNSRPCQSSNHNVEQTTTSHQVCTGTRTSGARSVSSPQNSHPKSYFRAKFTQERPRQAIRGCFAPTPVKSQFFARTAPPHMKNKMQHVHSLGKTRNTPTASKTLRRRASVRVRDMGTLGWREAAKESSVVTRSMDTVAR